MLTFNQALSTVKEKLSEDGRNPGTETLPLGQVCGRILAEDIAADRDYPPFHRSARDGYALRSSDLNAVPGVLEVLGEVRAGQHFAGQVRSGQCLQIMTGAPLPPGADAVVMVEQTRARGSRVEVLRAVQPGENVVKQGSEALCGSVVLGRGSRLNASEMGLLASVGCAQIRIYTKPRVAILTTGDEVVSIDRRPEWFQIRNANGVILSALACAAAAVPRELAIAPDRPDALRRLIEEGTKEDLLLLSGGVSAGKYDLAEEVLRELGAQFYFQGVAIRPGKPLVFGRVREKFFFGLPGNPVSTFVTFELFVRPALAMLQGAAFEGPRFLRARLGNPIPSRIAGGLTAFLPACVQLERTEPMVHLVNWQGSGDLAGMAKANCLLVIHPEQTELAAGEWVDVLPKNP